jgi:hypothetical protein
MGHSTGPMIRERFVYLGFGNKMSVLLEYGVTSTISKVSYTKTGLAPAIMTAANRIGLAFRIRVTRYDALLNHTATMPPPFCEDRFKLAGLYSCEAHDYFRKEVSQTMSQTCSDGLASNALPSYPMIDCVVWVTTHTPIRSAALSPCSSLLDQFPLLWTIFAVSVTRVVPTNRSRINIDCAAVWHYVVTQPINVDQFVDFPMPLKELYTVKLRTLAVIINFRQSWAAMYCGPFMAGKL